MFKIDEMDLASQIRSEGRLRLAISSSSPYCPYFALRPYTNTKRNEPNTMVRPRQKNMLTPAIYMTANMMRSKTSPAAR